MSYRASTPRRGGGEVVESLVGLADGLRALARRVGRIEASNRTIPPGYVFERHDDDTVWMHRISTGEEWQVVPPLTVAPPDDGGSGDGVTQEYVDNAIAAAVGEIEPGVSAAYVLSAIDDAIAGVGGGVDAAYVSDAIATAIVGMVTQEVFTVGGGTGTYVLSHSFGSQDFEARAYSLVSPFRDIMVEVQHTSTTTCTVVVSPTPAASSVRVVLLGAA